MTVVNRRTAAPLRVTERVDYALRSVLLLARHDQEFLTARSVAEHYGMSLKLLGGVLWYLSAAGIVDSRPGWHGGFRLARAPHEISLGAVIAAASGDGGTVLRQGGPPPPADRDGLGDDVVVRFWHALDRTLQRTLEGLTVADLAAAPDDLGIEGSFGPLRILGTGSHEPVPETSLPNATAP